MEEAIIISTSKELGSTDGVAIVDLITGANVCSGFKGNACGKGGKFVCGYI
jgi:hypothetical protein